MLITMMFVNIFPIERSRVMRIVSKATFLVEVFCLLCVLDVRDLLILLG